MQRKHQRILKAIFNRPISANIKWSDIEGLFIALGAIITEREGSRIAVILDNEVQVYHRPHPQPTTDKGAVASVRNWLDRLGYNPNDSPNNSQNDNDDDSSNINEPNENAPI